MAVSVGILVLSIGLMALPSMLGLLYSDVSMVGRIERWIAGLEAWSRSPILGYGQASIAEVAPEFYWSVTGRYEPSVSTHSDYVDIALRSGLLGLIMLLAFVFMIPVEISRSKSRSICIWTPTMSGIFASMLVMALIQQPFRHEQLIAVVWMLTGSLLASEE